MSRFLTVALALALFASGAQAALNLRNGNFDNDPDLGSGDDTSVAPTDWFQHYTVAQSWSDFRFGATGNGGWTANGITLGQNFLGDDFIPGPEDGYYYTNLGAYGGEVSAQVQGFGYNRSGRPNPAGDFFVGLYSTKPGTFTGADNADPAATGTQLGEIRVDISSLTGTVPLNQAFTLNVNFAGKGVTAGDQIWLRIFDGPDDGNTDTFDEPTIDNVTLSTVVPEPASAGLLLVAAAALVRRRRA